MPGRVDREHPAAPSPEQPGQGQAGNRQRDHDLDQREAAHRGARGAGRGLEQNPGCQAGGYQQDGPSPAGSAATAPSA